MHRIRALLFRGARYEPIENDGEADEVEDRTNEVAQKAVPVFSTFEYSVFLLLGISMLWAWNMFLAAAPYFYHRFQSSDWAATHFQPSILSVSTVTNLLAAWVLAKLQRDASYPRRVIVSLVMNIVIFTLLALSTVWMEDTAVAAYFGFLMFMVCGASFATGMNQNGVFAYVSGFGREEYTQAIMAGQGVAGVLPCIVQILSVLAVPDASNGSDELSGQNRSVRRRSNGDGTEPSGSSSSRSAFAYFITATGVSTLALVSFLFLEQRRWSSSSASNSASVAGTANEDILSSQLRSSGETRTTNSRPSSSSSPSKTATRQSPSVIGLWALFRKLRWPALAVFTCFAVTMIFPVFTAEILSVNDTSSPNTPRIFHPAIFIPIGFLFWNLGDLLGRVTVLIPHLSLTRRRGQNPHRHRPWLLFVLALARIGFIPLYLLCNIRGKEGGAVIKSDFFYLFVVQLLFGVTNGYVGSSCMMDAGNWVAVEEREAAGGFMSLMLVGGLAAGSLLSFLVAGT